MPVRSFNLALISALVSAMTGTASAGDLNPPTGPVDSTMKTLDEVEPRIPLNLTNTPGDANSVFKITNPGSYYLIGNLKGISGKHGIEIASSNVSIDLMGFHVSGVAGTLDGIVTSVAGLENISIRNGSVGGWAVNGVNIGLPQSFNCSVEGIRASNNAQIGIRVGSDTLIDKCLVFNNQSGILTGLACILTECTAYQNTQGLVGFSVSCVFKDCIAYDNTTNGIATGSGATITDCVVRENGLHGIQTGDGCTVVNCTAERNSQDGFWIGTDCLVLNNTSHLNGFDNDAAGIYVWGDGCRIEGNNCNNNDKGIEVNGRNNYIVKNTCADNTTNYLFAINNRYGPIINHTMTGTPAVNGNSAPSFLGTTDPWANFANDIP